ncbi:MAG: tRNA lysidine(34) synthetase TilS [Eubacteriales bacterium]|nr:tRNA lysidine(34) synthetase TilS [Eubacteriales bacterium]
MLQRMKKQIEEYHMLNQGDKVVLGVSGGVDSVCLLLLMKEVLKQYALSIYVVHVNHGIRQQDAKRDAEYVKQLCQMYDLDYSLYEGNVPELAKEWGMSEEEAGRTFRYQCFLKKMKQVNATKLATAHHMGDQAETVLFHLIRGADLSGMSGMHPVSYVESGKFTVIRPLLPFDKSELKQFVKEKQIKWFEDVTNQENQYSRNRLRNVVIPNLEKINAQAGKHIAEFATTAAMYQSFFERIVKNYMELHVVTESDQTMSGMSCSTNRNLLREQDELVVRAVLYEMMAKVCGQKKDLAKEHVFALTRLLDAQSGKEINLPYGMRAVLTYETLTIRKCFEEKTEEWKYEIKMQENEQIVLPNGGKIYVEYIDRQQLGEKEWKKLQMEAVNSKNNYTKFYDCDTIKDTLCVRRPEAEDYFVMNEQGNRKKISRYFIDCKIPREQRQSTWVIAMQREVIWLVGLRRCNNHRISDKTKYVLVVRYEVENHGKTD